MTRIMFWNIEKFGLNKVTNPSGHRQRGANVSQAAAAAERMTLIVRMVQQANPDIIVVVEVTTGAGLPGTMVGEQGVKGAWTLLINLQWASLVKDWCLVPPLRTSNREGVAVLYRKTKLVFSGPYRWSGGPGGSAAAPPIGPAAPPPGIVGAAYGFPENMLVGKRKVPDGARYNAKVKENFCAAQTTGWTPYPAGGALAPLRPREPYLTTFAETGAGGFVRDIAIISIHAPAKAAPAATYLRALATVNEIVKASVANEVRVVAGDFNVNLLNAEGKLAASYERLLRLPAPLNFALGLTPAAVPAGGLPAAAPGYYATHIKTRRGAEFWPPNSAIYPGYGYIGSADVANLYAIDNIFTRGGVIPPNFTILNPVVGSPFRAFVPPPAYAPPLGTIAVNRRGGLPTPAAEPPAPEAVPDPALAANIGQQQSFRGWNNYGRIRSTSDHLPIVMDV
jgi:endonuclease/exonuclease/phosphatase family metal-dependent hydrolase